MCVRNGGRGAVAKTSCERGRVAEDANSSSTHSSRKLKSQRRKTYVLRPSDEPRTRGQMSPCRECAGAQFDRGRSQPSSPPCRSSLPSSLRMPSRPAQRPSAACVSSDGLPIAAGHCARGPAPLLEMRIIKCVLPPSCRRVAVRAGATTDFSPLLLPPPSPVTQDADLILL